MLNMYVIKEFETFLVSSKALKNVAISHSKSGGKRNFSKEEIFSLKDGEEMEEDTKLKERMR